MVEISEILEEFQTLGKTEPRKHGTAILPPIVPPHSLPEGDTISAVEKPKVSKFTNISEVDLPAFIREHRDEIVTRPHQNSQTIEILMRSLNEPEKQTAAALGRSVESIKQVRHKARDLVERKLFAPHGIVRLDSELAKAVRAGKLKGKSLHGIFYSTEQEVADYKNRYRDIGEKAVRGDEEAIETITSWIKEELNSLPKEERDIAMTSIEGKFIVSPRHVREDVTTLTTKGAQRKSLVVMSLLKRVEEKFGLSETSDYTNSGIPTYTLRHAAAGGNLPTIKVLNRRLTTKGAFDEYARSWKPFPGKKSKTN